MILIQNDQSRVTCPEELLTFSEKVLTQALQELNLPQDAEVSVVFVDDVAIQDLNREYRQKDTPTDVLSFAQQEGEDLIDAYGVPVLGDIVISLERATEQAESFQHSLMRELAFLLVHGLLHLVGYDHDEEFEGEMREKQEAVLRAIAVDRSIISARTEQ